MNSIADSTPGTLGLIDDFDHFAEAFTIPCQRDVLRKLDCIHQLQSAPRKQRCLVREALAHKYQVGESTISNWLKKFKTGGFLALVDYRKFPKESGLPPQFVSWVEGIFDAHQRDDDGREVQRVTLAQLALWKKTGDPKHAIPGYTHPPKNLPNCDHPRGWSARNILRLKPAKYQRKAAKQGQLAASMHLPPVLTTRVGSGYLSRILFDDQDYDTMLADGALALAGVKQAVRPVSFNALDFYTAAHLDNHMRLEYPDLKTGKKKTLTSLEFQWFAINILQNFGYRTDALKTELIAEHGTAAFWKAMGKTALGGEHSFNEALQRVTDGQAFCNTSGLTNQALFKHLYFKPSSTGNFKFKTWIESSFRLLRTYMQALPGPIGSHARLNGRAELHGIQQREKYLLTQIADHLDPHSASLIKHELLSPEEFGQLIDAVYRAMNARTDHKLEGWHECGFTWPAWRASVNSDEWYSREDLERLSPDKRDIYKARIAADPAGLTRNFLHSPAEALELSKYRDRKNIKKLEDKFVGLLLPMESAIERTVKSDHTITIKNPLWPDVQDTYVCQFTDRNDMTASIPPGTKLNVHADPFNTGKAHLYSDQWQYLGTLHRTIRATPFDKETTLAQLKIRSASKTMQEATHKARSADIGKHRTAREKQNDRIISGDLSNPGQRRTKSAQKSADTRAKNTAKKRGNRTGMTLDDLSS